MIRIVISNFLIIVILFLVNTSVIAESIPSEWQVISWLKELKPLPKVHYSYPLPFKKISDELLFEYGRITQAISISAEWNREEDIDRIIRISQKINKGTPKNLTSIGVNYSIWHRRFGKNLPPTDTGATYQEELELLREKLTLVSERLAKANHKYNENIKVSRIIFDSERFHIKNNDLDWNKAITEKYNNVTEIVEEIFPFVKIEWYSRGAVLRGSSETGWERAGFFTLKEKGSSFNCPLYTVPEIGIMRETFRRTVELAHKHSQEEVIPWVALASGYRRKIDKFQAWSADWNYDLIYSWKLGAEINQLWFSSTSVRQQRFAPWNMAKTVIFYPPPFDERTPHWAKHFVAYIRGAHHIKSLP